MGAGQLRLEVADEAERRRGGRVAPVEQRVDADPRDPAARGQPDQREQVAVVRVDATGPDEPDRVEDPGLERAVARGEERRARVEGAVGDRRVDPRAGPGARAGPRRG